MNGVFRFKIAIQTIKDYWRTTFIITLLFMGMAVMYSGMYPSFKEPLVEMMESGMADSFSFFKGAGDMASYVGFLNLELYQIFWLMILAIMLGFIAASSLSKEIEGKTIDLLMSNPVSRKQIIFEKFVGLIPMFLIINLGTMIAVMGVTVVINEELNFTNLALVHIVSIPYFLAVISIGLLISVILNEKMKAAIVMIAVIVGMYVVESLSQMAPDYEAMGYVSLNHYFNPYDALKFGEVELSGVLVLIAVAVVCLAASLIYFEHKDIQV
jgi:ABC-2 type transport system permease protein